MEFYIYATRRDDTTRYYWNRRKSVWQLSLDKDCSYPTRKGVNRIYANHVKKSMIWGKFHEIGFRYQGV